MKADDLNRYFKNFSWLVGWSVVALVVVLFFTSCASVPSLPAAGPQQKTAPIVANLNCIVFCDAQVSQSTALEDVKNNTGPVTAGAQTLNNTQTSSQTASPTTTETKNVTQKEGDGQ